MSNEDLDQFINFDLITVKSDIEESGIKTTKRTLDAGMPHNDTLLDRIDKVQIQLEDLQSYEGLLPSTSNSYTASEELLQLSTEQHIVNYNLFSLQYSTVTTIEELQLLISDVLVRFDTFPKNYQKDDYFSLLKVLKGSLLYLYECALNTITNEEIDEIIV